MSLKSFISNVLLTSFVSCHIGAWAVDHYTIQPLFSDQPVSFVNPLSNQADNLTLLFLNDSGQVAGAAPQTFPNGISRQPTAGVFLGE
jgi:hypothetical protein